MSPHKVIHYKFIRTIILHLCVSLSEHSGDAHTQGCAAHDCRVHQRANEAYGHHVTVGHEWVEPDLVS